MRHSSGTQRTLRVALLPTLLAGLLAACGGGGITGQELTGKVMDGYIKGAVVCLDVNANGVCNSDEPQAETTTGGVYTLDVPTDAELGGTNLLVEVPVGAIDEDTPDTPIATAYKMRGVASAEAVVSPLTTVLAAHLDNGETEADALTAMGLTGVDLKADYVATGNTKVHNVAKLLARNFQAAGTQSAAQIRARVATIKASLQTAHATTTAMSEESLLALVPGSSSGVASLAFASGYTGLSAAELAAIGYAYQGRTTEGGAFNWAVADGGSYGWGGTDLWWSGVAPTDDVPNFYWGGAGKADQAYMESWVNAPADGTLTLTGQGKLRLALWGNDELVGQPRFTPVIQLADNGSGCYARAEAAPLTPAATGAATYDVPLTSFSVVENCGVAMTAAEFMAKPIGSVRVRIYKANYYTVDGAYGKPNGINLGPISFQP